MRGKATKRKIGGRTRNLVSSSCIRLPFVASKTSSDFPCCAFALSAFGFGKWTPLSYPFMRSMSSSASSSRPANSTYYLRGCLMQVWVYIISLWVKWGE